jgi:two-component system NtrC family sensor kinase
VGLRDGSGAITHFVGVERDISEELRLRDQLVHSERLSAIGELVAGVAHEINNPLQAIVGCVELMLDERYQAIDRSDLELVRKEAARAGQIVRNLLSFVRRGSGDRAPADLNEIVRTMVDLREYHLRQTNISIIVRSASRSLPVVVNRDEIQQVVMNLLLNAEQAIASHAETGAITVETGFGERSHYLEVRDTGPGIRPELRGRIFEPFFTTKEVGQGTGLGLSISHGIASAHGGSLELHESDMGARFRLTLPAHVPQHAADPEHAHAARTRRALVIDDEPAIRNLMGRLLKRRGFEVLEASTGDDALALAATELVSLVFCDVRMPGINGFDLRRRLLAADPALSRRFIFITGDSTSVGRNDPELADVPVLPKPFTAADLDALLARMQLG